MTREEHKKAIIENLNAMVDKLEDDNEYFDALYHLDMLCKEIEPCEDCITLRLEKGTLKYSDKDYVVYIKELLKKWWQPELALLGTELPSVQPIRPKGEWKHIFEWNEERVVCKRCGHTRTRLHGDILHFCPNCGADMRGTE